MSAVTGDTGFLIGLERAKPRAAAARGSIVYTSDYEDLSRLRDRHFRGVRVLGL